MQRNMNQVFCSQSVCYYYLIVQMRKMEAQGGEEMMSLN